MGDFYLSRAQQVAAALESVAGTAETLTASDVLLEPMEDDVLWTPDFTRFSLPEVAPDIAEAPDAVGGFKAGIATTFALQCSGAVATAPAIASFMRACAMKLQVVHVITVGSISPGGAFAAGATYSATGGKAGIIEATRTGAGALRYIPTAGGALAASDVVTVGADSATASGTDATYAQKLSPTSTSQETMTLQRGEQHEDNTSGKDVLYRLRGAMGRYTLTFEPGDVVRFGGEFTGVVDGNGEEGDLFAGYTLETKSYRPRFKDATIQLNGVDIKVGTVTFDCGNVVEMDPDPSQDGGDEGYQMARVASRAPTISVAPYKTTPTILDELDALREGTSLAFQLLLDQESAGGIFELIVPAVQVRGWSASTRAGRRVAELQLNVVRSTLLDLDYAMYFR